MTQLVLPHFFPFPPLPPFFCFPFIPVPSSQFSLPLHVEVGPPEIQLGVRGSAVTSGGNNFNYFTANQLTKFKLCPPTS